MTREKRTVYGGGPVGWIPSFFKEVGGTWAHRPTWCMWRGLMKDNGGLMGDGTIRLTV